MSCCFCVVQQRVFFLESVSCFSFLDQLTNVFQCNPHSIIQRTGIAANAATGADYANSADDANSADTADSADSADGADNANNVDGADTANNAYTVGTVGRIGTCIGISGNTSSLDMYEPPEL